MSRRDTIEREAWRIQVIDGETVPRVIFERIFSRMPGTVYSVRGDEQTFHDSAEPDARRVFDERVEELILGQRVELQYRPAGKSRFACREIWHKTSATLPAVRTFQEHA